MLEPVKPDWPGFLANLHRESAPNRVFYFEHGIAENIKTAIAERAGLWTDIPRQTANSDVLRNMAVHRFLGHELFRIFPPHARIKAPKLADGWAEETRGPVSSWADLEMFAWPDPKDADLTCMEQIETLAPENMRAFHVMDIWEVVRELAGFETLCFALYEDPALVKALFERVGGFAASITKALCDFEFFGAIYIADDLGHRSGLMISPDQILEFVIPWHKRIAEIAHAKNKLFILHSCGDMYELINDYIDIVKIDAKHSFEDNILPVEQAKTQYGDRMTLLGGMDVDILARAGHDTIRNRTRQILDTCLPGGGYCLGSGNWVTDYIPVDNYLAMLDEARKFSKLQSAPRKKQQMSGQTNNAALVPQPNFSS